jgi:toxin-antitoxin system PIN domain toxin
VIIVDANVLIYAYDARSPHHAAARSWLEAALSGTEAIRFPLVTLLAFVRILTNPNLYPNAPAPADLVDVIRSWLSQPNVAVATPSDGHWPLLAEVATIGQARGAALMDAHLAALAIEHGAVLATTDRGFARFEGLRTTDPVTPGRGTRRSRG